ncbi:MAG: HAD family hydrolase [bacterium]|nr:HAD family hydrolase [bacterium]
MPGAIIFDLDGTLTVPVLDFDAIRRELGLVNEPILEAMQHMDASTRQRAEAILERHERQAAHQSNLQPGAATTLAELRRRRYPIAILTRNTRRWTTVVIEKHGLSVDALRCRDDGAIKPSKEPIESLCEELSCDVATSWMVGDHLFDIRSGREAGCRTVLMIGDRPPPAYAGQADHLIRRLPELLELVDS